MPGAHHSSSLRTWHYRSFCIEDKLLRSGHSVLAGRKGLLTCCVTRCGVSSELSPDGLCRTCRALTSAATSCFSFGVTYACNSDESQSLQPVDLCCETWPYCALPPPLDPRRWPGALYLGGVQYGIYVKLFGERLFPSACVARHAQTFHRFVSFRYFQLCLCLAPRMGGVHSWQDLARCAVRLWCARVCACTGAASFAAKPIREKLTDRHGQLVVLKQIFLDQVRVRHRSACKDAPTECTKGIEQRVGQRTCRHGVSAAIHHPFVLFPAFYQVKDDHVWRTPYGESSATLSFKIAHSYASQQHLLPASLDRPSHSTGLIRFDNGGPRKDSLKI
eukprot:3865241-Amphidinium_carterae.1